MPSRRINHITQIRILKHDPRIRRPGPAQIIRARRHGIPRRGRDGRLVDDVVRRIRGRGAAAGSDVPERGGEDADIDAVEPGGRVLAEDEIRGADDQRLGVDLQAGLRHQRVLEARQLAAVVALVGGVGGEGEGLGAGLARRVGHVDVVEFGVGRPVADGGSGVVVGGGCEAEGVRDGYCVGAVG